MPASDLLDQTTLANLVELDDGGYGLVKEMLAIFREDTPRRIQDILSAASRNDADALSRAAHALKGGAGTLGAKAFRALAADLEALGRSGSTDGGSDLRQRLEAAFKEAETALEFFIREGEGSSA
jgi:HPt (histidine-containing phosphotransfer) domain-containing protein